jgi:hypothetical protein
MGEIQGMNEFVPEPEKSDTEHLQPGIYQAKDGYKYRVFSDGSAYRLVKRIRHRGRIVMVPGEPGDAMIRMGRAQVKKVNAVPPVATQEAAVPSVPTERTAGGTAP